MLGQLLLRGDKKRKLIDEGFNRHANHDTNLPEWFADDERKYRGPAGYAMDLPEDLMEQARHRLNLTLTRTRTLALALTLTLTLTQTLTLTLTLTRTLTRAPTRTPTLTPTPTLTR